MKRAADRNVSVRPSVAIGLALACALIGGGATLAAAYLTRQFTADQANAEARAGIAEQIARATTPMLTAIEDLAGDAPGAAGVRDTAYDRWLDERDAVATAIVARASTATLSAWFDLSDAAAASFFLAYPPPSEAKLRAILEALTKKQFPRDTNRQEELALVSVTPILRDDYIKKLASALHVEKTSLADLRYRRSGAFTDGMHRVLDLLWRKEVLLAASVVGKR